MAKHTPGPWNLSATCKRNDHGVPHTWVNLESPGHLGGMKIETHSSMPDEELDANTRLIAAAPELLDALQRMVDMFERHIDGRPGPDDAAARWDCARAAIEKAIR